MQISVYEQIRSALHSAVFLSKYAMYDVIALNQIKEKQNHLTLMLIIENQNQQLEQNKKHFETIDEALQNCPTPADEDVNF